MCPELRSAVEDVLPVLREQGITVYLLSDEGDAEDIHAISEAISQAPDTPIPRSLRANVGIRSIALYIYTSGTTGKAHTWRFSGNLWEHLCHAQRCVCRW